jgi:4'-phosphopantetheinyl transferase
MPVLLHKKLDAFTQIGVWQITETESELTALLQAQEEVVAELGVYKSEHRKMESIAARLMLHRLTESASPWRLEKDVHSKPFFTEHSQWHCALSHSHGLAAAMISNRACGIDLQRFTAKMASLAHKFVNKTEAAWISGHSTENHLDLYHLIWCAKEAMYKVHGRKSLDFRAHILVHDFSKSTTGGLIQKNTERIECALESDWLQHNEARYCLVSAVETV